MSMWPGRRPSRRCIPGGFALRIVPEGRGNRRARRCFPAAFLHRRRHRRRQAVDPVRARRRNVRRERLPAAQSGRPSRPRSRPQDQDRRRADQARDRWTGAVVAQSLPVRDRAHCGADPLPHAQTVRGRDRRRQADRRGAGARPRGNRGRRIRARLPRGPPRRDARARCFRQARTDPPPCRRAHRQDAADRQCRRCKLSIFARPSSGPLRLGRSRTLWPRAARRSSRPCGCRYC